ncbi:glycosyltransferase family protein [Methanobacterium sp.]|uniref:glycosyltransferase family protein n=1 Tax=Methanobacterium sp. TaxID=2164 RepID=UPI002ABC8E15|nr:glycosyltransferase family protein [Methanobacterium sp.]MDY9922953.1 glycosyltransferase family protein [Methanobacterium sp.]
MKVDAIIAARMYSTRMYGKPLKIIQGKPIIEHVIDRLRSSKLIDEVILAVSENDENQVFLDFAKEKNLKFVTGDEEDVLGRINKAANTFNSDHIVRVTSENPLIYVEDIDKLINFHLDNNCDFTYFDKLPIGSIVEVISSKALKKSFIDGEKKHHSELVTLFINENPKMFKIKAFEVPNNLKRPNYRLTVDTPADLKLMRILYHNFYQNGKLVNLNAVISFLDENPELLEINNEVPKGDSRIWE